MAEGILVVVALRQGAGLTVEALAAGVVAARLAPAISPPVAQGLRDLRQERAVGDDCPTLARGDVMRGVETASRQLAEGPHRSARELRPEGITAVLNEPQVMLAGEGGDRAQVEGVAQR